MSSPFVAEIRLFPYNFAPVGWAFCQGQLIPIAINTALFALIGTTYGGNGQTNFALPNLQGIAPLQAGQGNGLSLYDLGQTGGSETVTLQQTELPIHNHPVNALSASGDTNDPSNHIWATAHTGKAPLSMYSSGPANTQMSPFAFSTGGGGQPHNNMPPYLTLNFCIALQGIFPPRG